MKSLLPIALAFAAVAAPTADAAVFEVVSATHASSSSKTEEGYAGTSTAAWKLAKPTRTAANRIRVDYGPGYGIAGLGTVSIKGAYGIDVTTDWKNGRCAWTALTGDRTRPMSAPAPFELVVGRDPENPRRAVAGFTGLHASLANGYLGTECSTSVAGEPSRDVTALESVPLSTFKKRRVTLRFAGSTAEAGIAYAWSTKIVLERARR